MLSAELPDFTSLSVQLSVQTGAKADAARGQGEPPPTVGDDRKLTTHLPPEAVEDAGASRACHARVHRLVEQPPPAHRDRRHPASGEGGDVLR